MPTADSYSKLLAPKPSFTNYDPNLLFYKGGNAAPATAAAPAPAPAPAPSYGGGDSGGGGGGGGFAAAAPTPPRISLQDYINNDFAYKQSQDEYGDGGRRMQEFDAQTARQRGETERDVDFRKKNLEGELGEASIDSAEDLAGRGMLRSGGLFLAQDKINQEGNQRRSSIDDILADFISQRDTERVSQQQQNRAALNEQLNQITQRYQSQYGL